MSSRFIGAWHAVLMFCTLQSVNIHRIDKATVSVIVYPQLINPIKYIIFVRIGLITCYLKFYCLDKVYRPIQCSIYRTMCNQ